MTATLSSIRRLGRPSLLSALVCLALAGCTPAATPSPDASAPDAAGSTTTATESAAAPEGGPAAQPVPTLADAKAALAEVDANWPTEMYNGEAGAAKKVILDAMTKDSPLDDAALAVFAPDFRGEDLTDRPTESLGVQSGIALGNWEPQAAELDAQAFRDAFNRYLGEFETIDGTEIHTWELQIPEDLPDDQLALEAKEALWVVGTLPDGRLREDRMLLVFDLVRPKDVEGDDKAKAQAWKIAGVRTEEARSAIGAGPAFRDVTAQALPGGYDQIGAQIYTDGGPVFGDFDADGDPDLFLPRQHAAARLYENDGTGKFTDATALRGLQVEGLQAGSNSGVFFDYDQDGRLDLVVGLKEHGLRLFRNEGEVFEDVTGAWPLLGPGQWQTLAVADYDDDGYPDIYATNYGLIDTEHQPESYVDARDGMANVLLRNNGGDGSFTDVTEDTGLGADNHRWTYAAAWADYDADGDMDLYVANDYGPKQLFRNDGDGRFEDVAAAVGAQDFGNGMGVSWLDFDNDLDLDIYNSNMQSFAGNRITRLAHFPGTPEQRATYRRFSQGNTLLRSDGQGGFEEWSEQAGVKSGFWAWGNVPLDYDADGDLDIFTSAGFYTGESTADT